LDAKGLVALWREGLLAQSVLLGKTKGYRDHPQLDRFKDQADPKAAIGFYLKKVHDEATKRGYKFNAGKITTLVRKIKQIKLHKGQLAFEIQHLSRKLKQRDPRKFRSNRLITKPKPHPLFKLVDGGIAGWEK
jgi:hypothetical protein